MAAGAVATIKAHKSACRVAHPKGAKKSTIVSQTAATRLGGGPGPVVRDKALPAYK